MFMFFENINMFLKNIKMFSEGAYIKKNGRGRVFRDKRTGYPYIFVNFARIR